MGRKQEIEDVQKLIAKAIARHPAGRNLALIGGFRYRFLDGSVRTSDDIDYHWAGDLADKMKELADLFSRVVLPDAARRYGYLGRVDVGGNPAEDSSFMKTVTLSLWKDNVSDSRLEISVEITRIICADPITVRTAEGVVFATASENDMIESKVIAMFSRLTLQHRDIVDLFLFGHCLGKESGKRLEAKFKSLGITHADLVKRMQLFEKDRHYHVKAVQAVIDMQLEPDSAKQLNDTGGGEMLFDQVMMVLRKLFN